MKRLFGVEKRWQRMGIVAVWLLTVNLGFPPAVQAQGAEPKTPLECLEAQRLLLREFRSARKASDVARALSVCERLLALPHLVSLPGDPAGVPPRDHLRDLGNAVLKLDAAKVFQRAEAKRQGQWGTPCNLCRGAGSFRCTRCQGRGSVQQGRKTVPCDALFPCADCRGSGRAGSPAIAKDLERVSKAARVVVNAQGDILTLLKTTFEGLPRGLDIQGFREVGEKGSKLRGTVPIPPFQATKLGGKQRRDLKKLWDESPAEERRAFVRGVILDSLRFGEEARCLAASSSADLKRELKKAKTSSAASLLFAGADAQGSFFEIEAELRKGAPPKDHPFGGTFIGLAEFDGDLIAAHYYDVDGKKRLDAARRFAILETINGLAQSYPFKRMERGFSKLEDGTKVKLRGRLLHRPDHLPARLFEVWEVEQVEGAK